MQNINFYGAGERVPDRDPMPNPNDTDDLPYYDGSDYLPPPADDGREYEMRERDGLRNPPETPVAQRDANARAGRVYTTFSPSETGESESKPDMRRLLIGGALLVGALIYFSE